MANEKITTLWVNEDEGHMVIKNSDGTDLQSTPLLPKDEMNKMAEGAKIFQKLQDDADLKAGYDFADAHIV